MADWKSWHQMLENKEFDELNSGDIGEPARLDWWNDKWIPIGRSISGDCICVDLDPGTGGVSGQMIEMFHDDDRRTVLAPDFAALLAEWLA